MLKTLLIAALGAGMAAPATAATISTIDSQNNALTAWGHDTGGTSAATAYGQTFTLDSAHSLDNVTFAINDWGDAVGFDLQVFAWSGSMATGTSLGSVAGATAGVSGFTPVSVDTGGIDLAAGIYVAFLQATSTGIAQWGMTDDLYSGGSVVFQYNDGDTGKWTTEAWPAFTSYDFAFSMAFTPLSVSEVPLPAAGFLLIAGLGGLFAAGRRRA